MCSRPRRAERVRQPCGHDREIRVLDEARELVPLDGAVEAHAEPAALTDRGRHEEAVRRGSDQQALHSVGGRTPETDPVVVVVAGVVVVVPVVVLVPVVLVDGVVCVAPAIRLPTGLMATGTLMPGVVPESGVMPRSRLRERLTSSTSTSSFCLASSSAATSPLCPAPTTTTSAWFFMGAAYTNAPPCSPSRPMGWASRSRAGPRAAA